jgi:hypothetical protein
MCLSYIGMCLKIVPLKEWSRGCKVQSNEEVEVTICESLQI